MKMLLPFIPSLVLISSLLAGCADRNDPSSVRPGSITAAITSPCALAPPPSVTNQLITTLGEHSAGANWKVRVPEGERSVEVGWQGSSQKPSGWRAQAGWFVLVENDQRVWAYDGDGELLLFEFTPTSDGGVSSVSGPTNFGCPVPEVVLARLSDAARKAIKRNG